MNGELIQLLANSSGAVVVTGIFIMYLIRKDKSDQQTYTKFNDIIKNHLNDSSKSMREVASSNVKVAEKMQLLTDTITHELKGAKNRYSHILKKLSKI